MSSNKTDWTVVPAGKSEAAWTKFRNELGADGSRVIAQLDEDTSFRRKLAAFARRGGIIEPASLKLVRYICGKNSFLPEDWATFYGAQFSKRQLRDPGKFPWGEDILNSTCPLCGKRVLDCHFAFWGLEKLHGAPLTVARWITLHPATGQPRFYFSSDPWHVGQPHTDVATMEYRWHLLHKEIVSGSTGKTPEEQAAMLPAEYEVPTTIAEVSKDILVFRNTGERPNGSRWAACKERTIATARYSSAGVVSCVGNFGHYGLNVNSWHGYRSDLVGVGASRKFPQPLRP